jgi:hypothetical protein
MRKKLRTAMTNIRPTAAYSKFTLLSSRREPLKKFERLRGTG